MPLLKVVRRIEIPSPVFTPAAAGSIALFIGTGAAVTNGYSAGTKSTSVNGGTNLPACVFFAAFGSVSDDTDPTAYSIGSQALTKIVAAGPSSNNRFSIWGVAYAGGSDTLSFTNGNGFNKYAITGAWVTGGGLTGTAVSTQTCLYGSVVANAGTPAGLTSPVAIPSGGVGFCAAVVLTASADNTQNWGNSETSPAPSDILESGSQRISIAVQDSSGNWSPTYWGSGAGNYDFACGLAACAFGP